MKTISLIILIFVLTTGFVANDNKTSPEKQTKIQIALLLDTSNSMDGLIDQAKAQLWKIVNELALARYAGEQPILEIALYEYGNDRLKATDGYTRLVVELSTDLDKISEELFALKTYGGHEYCGYAINHATKNLKWSNSNDDLKIIYIAGNEEFNQGTTAYQDACKTAISKGIIINTIFCGDYAEGVNIKWKDGADLADGTYMNINTNAQTVYIQTPFDDEINQLNSKLNTTYIGYGSKGKINKTRQAEQDNNAATYGSGNVTNRAISKSSKAYDNSSWDLVDAVKQEKVDMDKVSEEELPDEMKGMNKEQRKKYLDDKKTERETIQKKINELGVKRNQYITNKQKEQNQENTLDNAMLKSVRTQAEKKSYKFVKE